MFLLVIDYDYKVYGAIIEDGDEELLLASNELLSSATYRSKLNEKYKNSILIANDENNKPYLMLTDFIEDNIDTVTEEVIECARQAYTPNLNISDNDRKEMVELIKMSCDEDTAEVLEVYFKTTDNYLAKLGQTSIIDFGVNPITACVSPAVYKELKQYQGNIASILIDNVMETPEDKVMFQVPKYQDLDRDFLAYPNIPAYIMNYRTEELKKAGRSAEWRERCTDDILPLIMGNVSNNNLPIQDNEQDYYDALCNLMREGLQKEYPDTDVEQLIKAGQRSEKVKEYLINLCHLALIANWMHTGKIAKFYYNLKEVDKSLFSNLDIEVDLDNNSSSDNRTETERELDALSETKAGYYCVSDTSSSIPNIDAKLVIKGYIEQSSDTFAPCEAVIKLLRWGNRKPSKLKISGTNRYVDLTSFNMSTSDGDMSKLEKVIYDDGSNCVCFEGIVLSNRNFSLTLNDYSNYCQELGLQSKINGIVGLRLITQYEGTKNVVVNSTDFLTIIEEYVINQNENFKIANIEFDSDEFKFKVLGDVQDIVEGNSVILRQAVEDKQNPYKSLVFDVATTMKDMAMESNVHLSTEEDRKNITLLGLIPKLINERNVANSIKCNVFNSKEELEQALRENKCTSKKESLAWSLIDSFVIDYLASIMKANTYDLEEMLNKLLNDESFMSLLSLDTNTKKEESTNSSLTKSIAFSQETRVQETEVQRQTKEIGQEDELFEMPEQANEETPGKTVINKDVIVMKLKNIEVGFIVFENKERHVYNNTEYMYIGNVTRVISEDAVLKTLDILMRKTIGIHTTDMNSWTFHNGKLILEASTDAMFS